MLIRQFRIFENENEQTQLTATLFDGSKRACAHWILPRAFQANIHANEENSLSLSLLRTLGFNEMHARPRASPIQMDSIWSQWQCFATLIKQNYIYIFTNYVMNINTRRRAEDSRIEKLFRLSWLIFTVYYLFAEIFQALPLSISLSSCFRLAYAIFFIINSQRQWRVAACSSSTSSHRLIVSSAQCVCYALHSLPPPSLSRVPMMEMYNEATTDN